ncbi:MAG: hypothetical protein JRI39_14255 [Deltaproteobacteria bacterium]|nr:hypothetical protein [Deltaproteobacteria bacterium]MBW2084194.1 hypothetical protein [Deltaproteobacteria bacterium]
MKNKFLEESDSVWELEMDQANNDKVAYLKRVTLVVGGGSSRSEADISQMRKRISFIFGIGTDGLSPFEMELSGRAAGDVVYLDISGRNRREFFGHVLLWFMPEMEILESEVMKVLIERIEQPSQRDVVKELAEISEYSHGCSCC